VLAASDQARMISHFLFAMDLAGARDSASAHQLKSLCASFDIRRCWCLDPGGKKSSMLYRRLRKVRPSGITVETKFKYPVIFWISSSDKDFWPVALSTMACALKSFFCGKWITMPSVMNSIPAKLTTFPPSFLADLIVSPTVLHN